MNLFTKRLNARKLRKWALISVIAATPVTAPADDTEIYRSSGSSGVQPNVIFIFDTSGSMGNSAEDGTGQTRMQVAKDAAISIIGDPEIDNINFGLARFDVVENEVYPVGGIPYSLDSQLYSQGIRNYRDGGGYIEVPAKDISDDAHRSRLITAINELPTNAWTPLVETYDETIRYFKGEEVRYGKKYGAVQCSDPGYVTVTVPPREEDIIECQQCSLWLRSPQDCRRWRLFGGWTYGTVSTVPDSYCQGFGALDPQTDWIVTGTNTIPGYEYEEWRDGGCEAASSPQYFYLSNSESYDEDTGKYKSPVTNSCQQNHVVIFTDGASTQDGASDTRIRSLLAEVDSSDRAGLTGISTSCATSNTNQISSNSCLEELALYSYEVDLFNDSALDVDPSSSTEEVQRITTHTIGAFMGSNDTVAGQLERAAEYSDGLYRLANNSAEIKQTLRDLFNRFENEATIGTSSPAVAVNALNRLESSEELYYTVFEPKATKGWSGNLKRYKLGSSGKVLDADSEDAVDEETGYFAEGATSIWTKAEDAPDGKTVGKGGASSHFTLERNVVTYAGGADGLIDDPLIEKTALGYLVPSYILEDLFSGALADLELIDMLKWASGIDTDAEGNETPRQEIEDPLHSEPLLLNYGTAQSYESVIYFGTNSGYLHAMTTDIDGPEELFAYVPYELLSNIEVYYREGAEYGKHYGLDGPITAFIHNDTELEAGKTSSKSLIGASDKAYMYAGMRRGGEGYYALNVTNPRQPEYLWQITSDDTGFERLGQTWSAMKPIYVSPEAIGIDVEPEDSKPMPVLVFGGGYDPSEDDTSGGTRISHSRGNAIYMVNALTGELLWTASPDNSAELTVNGMTNSIVSDITAIDNDGNGTTDILYAADTGGRIWRIDLFSDSNSKATEIADLNDGSIANNTRFYTSPVVAYNAELDSYVIAIGSGYRAHPLVTDNKDRFFVIIDDKTTINLTELKQQLNSYRTIELDDLADSGNLDIAANADLANGFYLELQTTGEKALTDAIIADNTVYFGTYSPVVSTASSGLESCSAATGATNLYSVDFSAYNPGDNSPVVVIEQTELKQTGIPAEPKIVFPPSKSGSDPDPDPDGDGGGECEAALAILIGSESVALDSCTTVSRNYWREL